MKISASESITKACFNLERLSRLLLGREFRLWIDFGMVLIQNANPANIKQLFGPENLPGRSINRLQERSVDIRTYARTYVCSLCMDSCHIFYKKKIII